MNTSYLDYYKLILEKVSFDHHLFTKELEKANQVLTLEEKSKLRKWLLEKRVIPRPTYRAHQKLEEPVNLS
ncbi:hypothetical protein [Negadavirga shengliensis]|uniref:Uncharacterized protein n=1 Tax=Negadavirga shengliensis TaxID=1389218 RepID=A0ABV9SZY1_9BACT